MQFKAFGEDESGAANIMDYNDVNGAGTGQTFQQSHNAYMLVYEKAKKKPLKLVCSPDNVNLIKTQPKAVIDRINRMTAGSPATTNLSCDGTAIFRDL